jgi:two-component system chemotaxis response regulator CheB
MAIENGIVYIAAPNHHMLIGDGRIALGRGPRENMVRPAIDALFRSAAMHYGPRVIGAVLSGFLCDGAAGLNAIKRCGGMTLVQDPEDAVADEMPRRALEAATADLCVPSARIGDLLVDLSCETAGTPHPVPPELRLEVAIAAGDRIETPRLSTLANPVALTFPSCGGVLSKVNDPGPLRFRCRVGHAFTADILVKQQEGRVDEALRVALRIIEERAELVQRMADDGRNSGRKAIAEMYDDRAREYRNYADSIRRAILSGFDFGPPNDEEAT